MPEELNIEIERKTPPPVGPTFRRTFALDLFYAGMGSLISRTASTVTHTDVKVEAPLASAISTGLAIAAERRTRLSLVSPLRAATYAFLATDFWNLVSGRFSYFNNTISTIGSQMTSNEKHAPVIVSKEVD